ncbi:hypothetical protein PRUPE_8G172100 [Prunus persica]|uniref:Uncharacterized protein n=1 Tax=Prunus persica TaxID=3760 RepID=A0A251MZ70_PRUPE|nr:hypothetical protein PRUPE_8G172100 [Prunus persica]
MQATVEDTPPKEINLISCGPLVHVSDIKLIRTDTTLDLSQKAEKGMLLFFSSFSFYRAIHFHASLVKPMWDCYKQLEGATNEG